MLHILKKDVLDLYSVAWSYGHIILNEEHIQNIY